MFFDCGWALFGNRAAGKRPRGGHSVYYTPTTTTLTNDGGLKNLDTRRDKPGSADFVENVTEDHVYFDVSLMPLCLYAFGGTTDDYSEERGYIKIAGQDVLYVGAYFLLIRRAY